MILEDSKMKLFQAEQITVNTDLMGVGQAEPQMNKWGQLWKNGIMPVQPG